MMNNHPVPSVCPVFWLLWCGLLSACANNVREAPADKVACWVEHSKIPDKQGFSWFAPALHASQYRILFFGYDTLNYRLVAPEPSAPEPNPGFRLLIDANYGGAIRHYDFAEFSGQSSRALSQQKHIAERCQIFNSLISSCIYRDELSLSLSKAELEQAQVAGLHLLLSSESKPYEQIDLPSNYIQGFLKAIGSAKGTLGH